MNDTPNNLDAEIRLWQENLLKRSIRRTRKLGLLVEMVGKSSHHQCLEISAGDGATSARLRALGGSWKTAVATRAAADSVDYAIPDNAHLIENGHLPFPDQAFDRVVIVDALKVFADDYGFIRECHRTLKSDGWVIISEERRSPASLVALLQRLFGTSPAARGNARNGYQRDELFNILKDGFDVPETIRYSNGLFEAAAAIGEAYDTLGSQAPYWLVRANVSQEELYRYRRLHGLMGAAYPLLWLLSKLEFLPGHRMLVKSRRRHWRPRLQPKLIDGRSIAEAAINTKIGTAAPF